MYGGGESDTLNGALCAARASGTEQMGRDGGSWRCCNCCEMNINHRIVSGWMSVLADRWAAPPQLVQAGCATTTSGALIEAAAMQSQAFLIFLNACR